MNCYRGAQSARGGTSGERARDPRLPPHFRPFRPFLPVRFCSPSFLFFSRLPWSYLSFHRPCGPSSIFFHLLLHLSFARPRLPDLKEPSFVSLPARV